MGRGAIGHLECCLGIADLIGMYTRQENHYQKMKINPKVLAICYLYSEYIRFLFTDVIAVRIRIPDAIGFTYFHFPIIFEHHFFDL